MLPHAIADIPLVQAKKRLTHATLYALRERGYWHCPACKEIMPLERFRKDKSPKGFHSWCRECELAKNRQRNRTPKRREWGRKRKRNLAAHRAYNRTYRQRPDIKEKRRKYKAQYKANHRKPKAQNQRGVYVIRMGDVCKIGKSQHVHERIANLSGGLPHPIEVVHIIPVAGDLDAAEYALHQQFAGKRLNGEWFSLTPDDITAIQSVAEL